MRTLSGASFILAISAISFGFVNSASAKPPNKVKAKAKAPPVLVASDQGFKSLGTTFCVPSSVPMSGCDVALPEMAMKAVPAPEQHSPRIELFGVSGCGDMDATGKACDVVWNPTQPDQRWRDEPEVRTGDVMPRWPRGG